MFIDTFVFTLVKRKRYLFRHAVVILFYFLVSCNQYVNIGMSGKLISIGKFYHLFIRR